MHGDRIINAMKDFFADATFADGGKQNHTMNGESKVKNYTLEGNNLIFDLYEGGAYKETLCHSPMRTTIVGSSSFQNSRMVGRYGGAH